MYILFADKINKFSCSIEIEGASVAQAKARIKLATPLLPMELLFPGVIVASGDSTECVITIPPLKTFLNEGASGSLQLELLVEDSIFFP